MTEGIPTSDRTEITVEARGAGSIGMARRPAKPKSRRSPDEVEIDAHVGQRIHERRVMLGLSQTDLAAGLGVTFQQLQMYEKGHNRISAGSLYACAEMLNVPVEYFFEGLDRRGRGAPEEMHSDEALKLTRAYYGIHDPAQRQLLRKLVETIAVCTG